MGLYYFYKNTAKQRANLRRTFKAIGHTSVVPTRVGGTRWVTKNLLAVQTFLKTFKAKATHRSDVVAPGNVYIFFIKYSSKCSEYQQFYPSYTFIRCISQGRGYHQAFSWRHCWFRGILKMTSSARFPSKAFLTHPRPACYELLVH